MAGWSTTDKNAAITVSGTNNVTLTRDASAAANKIARYATFYSTGKYYIEITLGTTGTADDECYGLVNSAFSLTGFIGGSTASLGLYGEASNVARFTLNNANTDYTLATDILTSGRVISLAYDFTNKRAWVRVNGGNWNGSGTANPATNVGGMDFSGLTGGPWTFGFSLYDPSTVNTTNFGKTAFTYTVPSGFAGPEQVNAYTLTAATGSFALTGQAAALTYTPTPTTTADNGTIKADNGSVTADGRAGRTLTASAGSFAITGQSASLLQGRRLTAATGSFAVTGKTAALQYGRKFTASTGAFAVTAKTANLLRGRTLVSATGAFVITGQTAGLNVANRTLPATAGAIIVTPKTTNFLRGYRISASTGQIVITGQSAAFVTSHWTPVASPGGTWTLVAQPGGTWTPVTPPTTLWS